MSNIVSNQRIRLALDLTQWQSTPVDEISSASPVIANGADLQFELAFSYGNYLSDAQVVSMANWSSVTIALKNVLGRGGLPYWSAVIPASALNNGLTFANWSAGTDQACVVPIASTANQLILASTQVNYWLEVSAQTYSTSTVVTGAVVHSGNAGTGYVVGDVVGAAGGTFSTVAAFIVATLGGSGAIATVTIAQPGLYSVEPGNGVSVTGGTGTGAKLDLTWGVAPAQTIPVACFPVAVVDSGIYLSPPAFVTVPTYYTAAQSDARYLLAANLASYAPLAGATFTGAVVLAADPTVNLGAATKQYVDTGLASNASASVPNTGISTIAGAKTFTSLLTATTGLTVSGGSLTIGALAGVLKAAAGVIAGGATTSDLAEGTNLYFTQPRVLAVPLTGYVATAGTIAATDTLLQAIEKLGYTATHLYGGATQWAAANQAAMLALSSAVKGDLAFRSDINSVWVLGSGAYSSLASWSQVLYPVSSVNGLTGAVALVTDNVPEGVINQYFTTARANLAIATQRGTAAGICPLDGNSYVPWVNLPPLTGYTSGAGTVSATDTILTAIQKLNGNIAGAVNPLTQVLTGYTSGAGTISSADTILGAIQKLNGNVGLMLPLAGGTTTGFINCGVSYGIYLNAGANPCLYLSSGRNFFDCGGNFALTTTASFAQLTIGYAGGGLNIDGSNNVILSSLLKMGSNKVIDQSLYHYDSSGNQILSNQQAYSLAALTDYSPSGSWSDSTAHTDFVNHVTNTNLIADAVNKLVTNLKAHGLIV